MMARNHFHTLSRKCGHNIPEASSVFDLAIFQLEGCAEDLKFLKNKNTEYKYLFLVMKRTQSKILTPIYLDILPGLNRANALRQVYSVWSSLKPLSLVTTSLI